MKKSQKVLLLQSDLLDIKEDIEEVKALIAMPDNNFAVINTILGCAVNKIDYIINDMEPKSKRKKDPEIEYRDTPEVF